MRLALAIIATLGLCACGSHETTVTTPDVVVRHEARLPSTPGKHAPSLVAIENETPGELSTGTMLADVDSCATCHPDVAAQWSSSAHSFASFGNPIYRFDVELVRHDLGKTPSRHCGGCHDMPLMVDGLMTGDAPIPASDLRAHSGVTCRLCHGVQQTTHDGNGSYVWNAAPIDAPVLGDAASIAKHKKQVTTKVDTELCVGCHRGFLSPDMTMPVHLSGIDEPGNWRNSAYTGNGMARIDNVEKQNCIDCHMQRTQVSSAELGAKQGSVASHRFVGGHTWMAAMRGDTEQLKLTRAKLEGAASIDVAGARVVKDGKPGDWHLPADGAPVEPGTRLELDVVIRNLLVGHRFPGGVLDIQDTWVELELVDAKGKRIAASGLRHETDPNDEDTHVLRTLVVDKNGEVLERHEMGQFRTQVATQTLAPREAQAVRYAFDVPARIALPVAVNARLRHRARTLKMQAATCEAARTEEGKAFIAGARGARYVDFDPCKPQPVTLVAQTRIEIGAGAKISTARPAWERIYEHGMALGAMVVLRVPEAAAVLDVAYKLAPDARAKAMVAVQLGWVASKLGKLDTALARVKEARELLATTVAPGQPAPNPPVFDALTADVYMRLNKYKEAVAPAKSCTERAPSNASAWSVYARALVAVGDYTKALETARKGLELSPRDPDLLRSQATSLAALKDPQMEAAQNAYVRFRVPDEAAVLRIRCAKGEARCYRNRNPVQTIVLR
ncbi:MAG TPA: tetratricopeptide repeat protein [Kofleriaceae bacterium]|nr:tetratricopeptide repeat protein [Kofleriaceae bacterium]